MLQYFLFIYGSFHIRLTVDVADLNEIIFFGSLSTINRHVLFCLHGETFYINFYYSIFQFREKLITLRIFVSKNTKL